MSPKFLMLLSILSLFFFNDTATTEIYTLSLHDALPICFLHNCQNLEASNCPSVGEWINCGTSRHMEYDSVLKSNELSRHGKTWGKLKCIRSEEHTSELQSLTNIVCRLLLDKQNKFAIGD